ncbi:tetratricopeptide repeat protein [Chryseobacterium sp. ISL-6]|uniref:tetratricopeptide repeat protein n=1 Tax=Chryseobacterium sp. ISL-6 TaxID=2819143 RepID=UPI001BE90535|nr:tetratricopeptide repeat protein [Chryseobacterium sp. ISL-6]MBT2622082.1 tetratricopeptide repeat protein [Chryseobacterium sp. ISL-6]
MKYILLLIPIFSFFSCSGNDTKANRTSEINKKKEVLSSQNNNTDSSDSISCKVLTKDQNVILDCKGKKTIYNGLIINEMSVSTNFIQEKENHFSIIYELNASVTKVKEKYTFSFSSSGIHLIYKEVIKYGKDGIMGNRIYMDSYNMKNKTFEDLQSLGNQVKEVFVRSNPTINYIDFRNVKFAEENFKSSGEDIFVGYPSLPKSNIKIINVEIANNQAFSLAQKGEHNDSKVLLVNILSQYPDRVVAYLNLADTDWALGNKEQARKNYNLYISLMQKQQKNLDKIPQRAYKRSK